MEAPCVSGLPELGGKSEAASLDRRTRVRPAFVAASLTQAPVDQKEEQTIETSMLASKDDFDRIPDLGFDPNVSKRKEEILL